MLFLHSPKPSIQEPVVTMEVEPLSAVPNNMLSYFLLPMLTILVSNGKLLFSVEKYLL